VFLLRYADEAPIQLADAEKEGKLLNRRERQFNHEADV